MINLIKISACTLTICTHFGFQGVSQDCQCFCYPEWENEIKKLHMAYFYDFKRLIVIINY